MTKQTSAFKREAQKRADKANKGWQTRKNKQEQEQLEYLQTKRNLAAANKEIEILNSSLKSAENALNKKDSTAVDLQTRKVEIINKQFELEVELKQLINQIIEYKTKAQSDLNILS